ncbi:MAG: zinc ribbon domain-containing protein [Armatimonadota bacterium]|nr:hypothetical protein [bacterium]
MKCKKCGAELHEDQKVCIACGLRTERGDNYSFGEKGPWRPTKNMYIGAAAVVVVIIVALILNSMRTVAPEVIADQWFTAMTQRQLKVARNLSTPQLEENLTSRGMDLMALSEEYYGDVTDNAGSFKIGKPQASDSTPNALTVNISVAYDGLPGRDYCIEMVKVGRQWRVDKVI